jgi:hypothetical protein
MRSLGRKPQKVRFPAPESQNLCSS